MAHTRALDRSRRAASAYFQDGVPLPPCSLGSTNYTTSGLLPPHLNTSDPQIAAYVALANAAAEYQAQGGRCVSIKGLPDIRLAVTYIILYTSLCTVLFMLLTTILWKGGLESAKRRSPIVWLLAASILLGLFASVFDTVFWTVQMVNARIPGSAYDGLYVVEDLMLFIVPWVVLWAMIMRLAVFWPSALFGRTKQFLVILPPSVLQCLALSFYAVVLRQAHHDDYLPPSQIPWNETATRVLGQHASPTRLRWDHAHFATSLAALLYVNLGLSRQWLRMRSTRGNGILAQMCRWIGLGPDPILRLVPIQRQQPRPDLNSSSSSFPASRLRSQRIRSDDPHSDPPPARLEDARLLRTLRPQRRVGLWWTIVRILHFIAFGFWVPTGITAANWAMLATQTVEVSMYLAVSLMYVVPISGIVACLGATSRFLDRENHYYPSHTQAQMQTHTHTHSLSHSHSHSHSHPHSYAHPHAHARTLSGTRASTGGNGNNYMASLSQFRRPGAHTGLQVDVYSDMESQAHVPIHFPSPCRTSAMTEKVAGGGVVPLPIPLSAHMGAADIGGGKALHQDDDDDADDVDDADDDEGDRDRGATGASPHAPCPHTHQHSHQRSHRRRRAPSTTPRSTDFLSLKDFLDQAPGPYSETGGAVAGGGPASGMKLRNADSGSTQSWSSPVLASPSPPKSASAVLPAAGGRGATSNRCRSGAGSFELRHDSSGSDT